MKDSYIEIMYIRKQNILIDQHWALAAFLSIALSTIV